MANDTLLNDARNLATLPNRPLLIISDNPHDIADFKKHLSRSFRLHFAHTQAQALAYLDRYKPTVALLDLSLGEDGLTESNAFSTMGEMVRLAPQTKIIAITVNSRRTDAARAVGEGAYDFYHKPIESAVLNIIVNRAYRWDELEQENRSLTLQAQVPTASGIIGTSEPIRQMHKLIEKLAPSDASVLLHGESGVGKELVARALHSLSPRSQQPFVAINCAAIPDALLESELFGHERGAFTGADRIRKGKIEQAQGGTLFLDEIGDLPLPLQAKLLRFLQERVIHRLGGEKDIDVDVRILCATHRDLRVLSQSGQFREDLFYRINEVQLDLPPLRERGEDCIMLARSFLHRFNADYHQARQGFSSDALVAIQHHGWPGNVRELENRVKRAVLMAESPWLTAHDLELKFLPDQVTLPTLREVRAQAERSAVQRALALSGGNISAAAKLLAVSRPTLYDLLRRYSITSVSTPRP